MESDFSYNIFIVPSLFSLRVCEEIKTFGFHLLTFSFVRQLSSPLIFDRGWESGGRRFGAAGARGGAGDPRRGQRGLRGAAPAHAAVRFPPASVHELFTRIEKVEEEHMGEKTPAVTHAVIGGVASHMLYKDRRW